RGAGGVSFDVVECERVETNGGQGIDEQAAPQPQAGAAVDAAGAAAAAAGGASLGGIALHPIVAQCHLAAGRIQGAAAARSARAAVAATAGGIETSVPATLVADPAAAALAAVAA